MSLHHCIRSHAATATLVICLALAVNGRTLAYQTYGVTAGGRSVALKWSKMPVRYYVTDRGVTGVTSAQLRDAASRAFASWQSVGSAAVSAEFVGFTGANPFDDDGLTTLGFLNRPDLDRVLGATDFLIDNTTGAIVEADIFFNSAAAWSVASGGESGRFDLETIVLHETGHLFGLGHSSLGETELRAGGGRRVIAAEAVMFPIAFTAGSVNDRTPRADDIAGLSELYPSSGFSARVGSLSGHVTKDGKGVFGAHVVAFNPQTGKLVGNLTVDAQGTFVISSLEPGLYVVRVEPIDDADLDSFFTDDDIPKVDLNVRITYFDRLIAVPAGGGSLTAEIKVAAK
jgi:hypothetical protein